MLKSSRLLAAAFVAVSFAMPLAAQDQTAAEAPTAETVVASVNGVGITLGHMIAARATLDERFDQIPPEELYNGILTQLVQQEALSQSSDLALPKLVELQLQNERRSLRAGMAIEALLETAVTDEAIQELYDERFGTLPAQEEFNASHILVDTEEEAIALKEALDGGADFAATARENSTGPTGPNGGNLGWFGPGQMVPEFEAATTALALGEVSEPVETQFGWHVIKLNDKRQANIPSLEDVREELSGQVARTETQNFISAAPASADVVVPEGLDLDPAILTQIELLD